MVQALFSSPLNLGTWLASLGGAEPGAAPDAQLRRGARGEDVRQLQRLLNAAGANPPLAEDGIFGPKTEGALTGFQGRSGLRADGVAGPNTYAQLLRALPEALLGGLAPHREGSASAPRVGESAPEGSIPAAELQGPDRHRPRRRASAPRQTQGARPSAPAPRPAGTRPAEATPPRSPSAGSRAPEPPRAGPATAVRGPVAAGPADGRLQDLQNRTMESARAELAAGVRTDRGTPNRGARVDQYARDAGMSPGGAWCGYFSSFNYSQAAQGAGGSFTGRHQMHSFEKARSFFAYRSYTNNSRTENQRLDNLQAQHEAQGSTRRFMTLSGSGGERWAQQHRRPHETFEPNTLPIRAGDTALFSRGHVGLVESYDRETGRLVTIEGNAGGGQVRRRTYDLNDPTDRARFEGFGRPALGDFNLPGAAS